MGSIATIVTLGFGSFGSVNLLPTLGYGIGTNVVTPQLICFSVTLAPTIGLTADVDSTISVAGSVLPTISFTTAGIEDC